PPVLGAELADGEIIMGQSKIARSPKPIKRVFLEPADCKALDEALRAINEADLIVLGPGSLFTSIIPNLLIKEIKAALSGAAAPVAYVCNVATQPGETDGFSVSQHVQALRFHGGPNLIDLVVVNTALPEVQVTEQGRAEPVTVDYRELRKLGLQVVGGDLIDERMPVRHEAGKLGRLLIRLVLWQKKNKDRGTAKCPFLPWPRRKWPG
ncbi:MAG: YvcK family protein, partial [Clostridia bacterium]|nr:YvcK family protein [Clostridia bacterium]